MIRLTTWFICCCLLPLSLSAQTPPFSTKGSKIVDSNGEVVKLKGVNWWGANGSKKPYGDTHHGNTDTHGMPFGLHVQTIETIAKAIKGFGFNAIRFPFSNEMLHSRERMQKEWVGPNTELIGKTQLEVMDRVIEVLTQEGLFVLLNNHSTTTHWCCNYDFNGLWFGKNPYYSQTPEQWMQDWMMLAERYSGNERVIGADLRNEVRPSRGKPLPFPANPNWGKDNDRDWHKAATDAGNAIHVFSPHWLIVVEGINGQAHWLTELHFPHLKPVIARPIELNQIP